MGIKPDFGPNNKLQAEWTNASNRELSKNYPYCILKFLYHRVNSHSSLRDCHFMIAEAICKFRNCLKFSLWIDKEPESHFDLVTVEFLVSDSISRELFDHATAYSRNVSGEDRKILGQDISSSSAINYHYDLFKNSQKMLFAKHGNLSGLQSQQVLRKVKSQYLATNRFSDDMWQDMIVTKKLMTVQLEEMY